MSVLQKEVSVETLLETHKRNLTKNFLIFITEELEQAKTARALLLIEYLIISKIESTFDKLFWEALKIILHAL